MDSPQRKLLALNVGRDIIKALLEIVEEKIAQLADDPAFAPAPEGTKIGRSGCRQAVPKSAMKCPSCGVGVYRVRSAAVIGSDGVRNKRVCDSCGYVGGTNPAVKTKAHRLALVVAIGERLKREREEENHDVF